MKIELDDKDGSNVVSIEIARERYDKSRCDHHQVTVDGQLSYLKCRKCKETVNPIWWIERLALKWHRVKALTATYREVLEELKNKERTRCEHCNRMTRVALKPKRVTFLPSAD